MKGRLKGKFPTLTRFAYVFVMHRQSFKGELWRQKIEYSTLCRTDSLTNYHKLILCIFLNSNKRKTIHISRQGVRVPQRVLVCVRVCVLLQFAAQCAGFGSRFSRNLNSFGARKLDGQIFCLFRQQMQIVYQPLCVSVCGCVFNLSAKIEALEQTKNQFHSIRFRTSCNTRCATLNTHYTLLTCIHYLQLSIFE